MAFSFGAKADYRSLSLIEGTFADVWSAQITVAYYAVLAASSFTGAASGKYFRSNPQAIILTLLQDR